MLYNLIRELNMENKVYLKGVTNDIESVYKAADAFVISSRYESFGLVTAEAMAHGLPVVGFSDCPGTNELIINEVNGLLVEPRSDRKDSLSESLDYLLSDCKLRTRLGNSAKQSITGKFSLQTVTDSWEKMLVDVYSSDKHRSVNRLNDSS